MGQGGGRGHRLERRVVQGQIQDFVKGGAGILQRRVAPISPRKARKKNFAFIFQLSGWAVVAPSWFAPQVPDVRGSMLHTHAERRRAAIGLSGHVPGQGRMSTIDSGGMPPT